MNKEINSLKLRCKASPGQFENEVAISGVEHDGEKFSLFIDRRFVEYDNLPETGATDAWLEVVELAREGDLVLVRLPGQTLANGQIITVNAEALECESRQGA